MAAYLVPRVRTVVARKALSTYIKYLTIPRALMKFMSAPTKANKYFDKQGAVCHIPFRISDMLACRWSVCSIMRYTAALHLDCKNVVLVSKQVCMMLACCLQHATCVHTSLQLALALPAGNAVYLSEKERIFGQKAKVTARLAEKAARRSQALAMSYSVSMVASYLLIWADSIARSKLA